MAYGIHFTFLLTDIAHRGPLNSEATVAQLLRDLVEAAGMRILAGPMTGREEGDAAHAGVSGVVILYESHAAIHTYPEIGAAFIDVFSCKVIPEDLLHPTFRHYFGTYEVQEKTIHDRGEHWSEDIAEAMDSWRRGRPDIE